MKTPRRRLRAFSAGIAATGLTCAGLALAAPANAAAYDLVVTDVRPVLAGTQATGSRVTFQATVKNQGTAPTPAVVHGVAFAVNGQTVSWNDVSAQSLAPGATRTLTATSGPAGRNTWTAAAAGSYTLRAWVDDTNRIPGETNEGNNTRTATVTTAAVKPVTDITAAPGVTQAQYQLPTMGAHSKATVVSWKVPAGQPAGVTYAVDEIGVTPDYCSSSGVITPKGQTAGTSLSFTISGGYTCGTSVEELHTRYAVTAVGPAGAPAVRAEGAGTCTWTSHYDHTQPTQDTSFGCTGSPQLTDYVNDGAALIDAGAPAPAWGWEGDSGFDKGTAYYADLPGLTEDQKTTRWGWSRYQASVDPSWFHQGATVTMTFVEPTFTAPGRRVFDVSVNGQVVAKGLDIFAEVGRGKPYVVTTHIDDPTQITEITARATRDNPIVSTIEVTAG